MEMVNRMTEREKKQEQDKRKAREKELKTQVSDRSSFIHPSILVSFYFNKIKIK